MASFGEGLSGVETAVMENITYKGSNILLRNGAYVSTCLLLKERETESLKQKVEQAIELFERKYQRFLRDFTGETNLFENFLKDFNGIFEIYLAQPFKINQKKYSEGVKTLNGTQKTMMKMLLSGIQKTFTLKEIFTILNAAKPNLSDPRIFAELYGIIQKGIIVPEMSGGGIK